MNKKLLVFGVLGLFAIGLVAAIGYYQMFSVTVNVNQPISIDGNLTQNLAKVNAGDTEIGEAITIKNTADSERIVKVVQTVGNENITVAYIGKMRFVGKDLVTGNEVEGSEENIVYSVTGETFNASEIPTGYKLIYYPDMDGGFAVNVLNILVYGEDNFPSLPVTEDIGDDYCNIRTGDNSTEANDAEVCNGAKLWLVEETYLPSLISGNWDSSKILFETDLITYTESLVNEITVPAESTITIYPTFTPSTYIGAGNYAFEFEIQ